MYSDFMVFILGWDRFETIKRQCFFTTDDKPYTRFYNYYLMDWTIQHDCKMKYDEKSKIFVWDNNQDSWKRYNYDEQVYKEILQLK